MPLVKRVKLGMLNQYGLGRKLTYSKTRCVKGLSYLKSDYFSILVLNYCINYVNTNLIFVNFFK